MILMRSCPAAPAFTLVAVATLALGIAVNTIAFTLLNSLALRPMPVRDASRIVRIYPVDDTGRRQNLFSYPDYQSYRDQLQSFDALVAYIPSEVTLGVGRRTSNRRRASPMRCRRTIFRLSASSRRSAASFTAERSGARRRARGRHQLFDLAAALRRRADVIGKTVVVNGRPFTIVGVGPRRFVGTEPLSPDVWVPLSAQPVLGRATMR